LALVPLSFNMPDVVIYCRGGPMWQMYGIHDLGILIRLVTRGSWKEGSLWAPKCHFPIDFNGNGARSHEHHFLRFIYPASYPSIFLKLCMLVEEGLSNTPKPISLVVSRFLFPLAPLLPYVHFYNMPQISKSCPLSTLDSINFHISLVYRRKDTYLILFTHFLYWLCRN